MRLVDRLLEQFPTDANLMLMKVSMLTEFGQRSQRIDILRSACTGDKTHPIFGHDGCRVAGRCTRSSGSLLAIKARLAVQPE